jgi:hypothetical protein
VPTQTNASRAGRCSTAPVPLLVFVGRSEISLFALIVIELRCFSLLATRLLSLLIAASVKLLLARFATRK